MLSLLFIIVFIAVIVNADKFHKWAKPLYVSSAFVQTAEKESDSIDIDMITVEITEDDQGVIQYVVQPGDSLGKIARNFGVTVSHIQKINGLKDGAFIRPWQRLIITDQEVGFLYTLEDKTNVVVFADKYNLNLEDLMTINYIQDETEMLYPGQELFINSTTEDAYKVGLLDRPKPILKPKATVAYKPVINKPTKDTNKSNIRNNTTIQPTKKTSSKIISQWAFNKDINNKFYKGFCTWYAAIIMPDIFPYIDENTQARPFGGNAREWCGNAKAAGFEVGQTPRAGSLIVYHNAGISRYRSAWHVGKVMNYYPSENKMILRDMNYKAKFIVTERWESTTNSNISCYIYPPKEPWKPNQ